MHIILVSDRLATAKTITITARHLLLAMTGLVALVLGLSTLFSYVTVRHAAEIRLPFLQNLVRAVSLEETQKSKEFVRENLNAMAVRLGQMQAQLMRLDSLSERLSALAGVKPSEIKAQEAVKDGRGGPLIQPRSLSAQELQQALDALSHQVEVRSDTLSILESQLLEERIKKSLLPTTLPVQAQWNASGFGWRVDPFTGEAAIHEGVDFTAEVGTSIKAAASGVVINVERHPQYGNMIEIDHGNELITRYAHASKIFTKQGALVRRGQKIAEVGTTGRSTGPHLHFEVRIRGVAQNPNRFLQQALEKRGQEVAAAGGTPRYRERAGAAHRH
ncbi:MAG: M23 family metallopeptidase [Rhodocyclaceae bacterium]|nr:M23 family metallopeptidase [Rhodocyclaceae bacterium]